MSPLLYPFPCPCPVRFDPTTNNVDAIKDSVLSISSQVTSLPIPSFPTIPSHPCKSSLPATDIHRYLTCPAGHERLRSEPLPALTLTLPLTCPAGHERLRSEPLQAGGGVEAGVGQGLLRQHQVEGKAPVRGAR